jgi:hypothetical protein
MNDTVTIVLAIGIVVFAGLVALGQLVSSLL